MEGNPDHDKELSRMTHKIKNYHSVAGLVLAMMSTAGQADTILGVYAGIGSWNAGTDGVFASQGDNIDIAGDLGFDSDQQNFFYAALEHPIPVIPNLKISQTALDNDSTNQVSSGFIFEGEAFNQNDLVDTTLDLTHTDFTAYYEVLDNWISLDIGLTARHFDGEASLTANGNNEQVDVEAWVPLGYVKAQFDLPLTGFYAGGEANAITFDDNGITDYTLRIGYESIFRFGAELGYRKLKLELDDTDDEDFTSDITIDGVYIAVTLHI
jgi:outer membrane protein